MIMEMQPLRRLISKSGNDYGNAAASAAYFQIR
jgi:hypothetical protein